MRREWPSLLQEGEPVLADLQLVAVLDRRRLDPLAVDEGAVEAALVLDPEAAPLADEQRVLARHGHVVEEDVAVGGASDHRALAGRPERLARAAAARADDECGALEPHLLRARRLLDLLGGEGLRRVARLL